MIGAGKPNSLKSGDGNDYLFGGGGDDLLDGGKGVDTAVYFGKSTDYYIVYDRNIFGYWDGSWKIEHQRGEKDVDGELKNFAGTDILRNIEFAQFEDTLVPLETSKISFQSDFAVVIDTTGSMGSSIDSVKNQASALITALFDKAPDSRIAIVGFKDTENGEPSQVILPFTDQVEFADRKAAAITALNSIGVGGSGDWPETDFDGL